MQLHGGHVRSRSGLWFVLLAAALNGVAWFGGHLGLLEHIHVAITLRLVAISVDTLLFGLWFVTWFLKTFDLESNWFDLRNLGVPQAIVVAAVAASFILGFFIFLAEALAAISTAL